MSTREVFDRPGLGYLLLLPTLLVSVVFLYYPAIEAVFMSFFSTLMFGTRRVWVGLDNYTHLATSPEYHYSVAITLLFSLLVVVGVMSLSLLIAYLIHEVEVGKTVYLVAAIWPYALPPAVGGLVVLYLIHPSLGVFTGPIEALGVEVNWFTNTRQAFVVIVLGAIWKQIGYNVIFMLAALNNVPTTLREVADLDGVSRINQLVRIYVPLISPTLIFLSVMNTIYAFFGTFAFVDVLTGGGPNGGTSIMIYSLYRNAFDGSRHGLASAESVVLFVIVSLLMLIQLHYSDRHAHYGG